MNADGSRKPRTREQLLGPSDRTNVSQLPLQPFVNYNRDEGKTEIGIVVAFISGLDRVLDPWRELIGFVRSTSAAKVQFDLIEGTLGRKLSNRREEFAGDLHGVSTESE